MFAPSCEMLQLSHKERAVILVEAGGRNDWLKLVNPPPSCKGPYVI